MSFDPKLVDFVMALRSRGISDAATLRAIEQVPRRYFVPETQAERAYSEHALPIDCGQVMSAPQISALLIQLLAPGPTDKVLQIGVGTGWSAAVMSRMSRRVYGVERYVGLVKDADARLVRNGIHNVELRHGDGRYGWPGQAPFSRILFTCAVRGLPEKVVAQLAPNGRMVAVVDGTLTLIEKARKHLTETEIMPLDLPMIEAGKSKTL